MTTRRLRIVSGALAPWIASASLFAAPLGQITPPPCSADGSCVPARATYGYHKTQWRLWPGTSISTKSADDTRRPSATDIGPTAKPDPDREDKLAPPKVDALEPKSREEEREDIELPDLGEFAPPPREPADNGGAERLEAPRPGFLDRPLGVPLDEQPAEGAQPRPNNTLPFGQPPAAPATPPDDLFPSNLRPYGNDVPPPLPFVISPGKRVPAPRRQVVSSPVLQASASLATHRDHQVVAIATQLPASKTPPQVKSRSHSGDTPPALPWARTR